MRKFYAYVLAVLFLLVSPFFLRAQYSTAVVGSTTHATMLVGSLPTDNAGNYEKLQVDVLGGGWGANNLGKTTYYVGNRGGITITQTTLGSAASGYTIKAYANSGTGNTDIYIVITADYPAIAINSFMLNGSGAQVQTVTQQTPAGTDITPAVVPVMITDQNGNIGIGTTSPQTKLDINGGLNTIAETHFSVGTYTDPVPGSKYAIKVGSNGIAVSGSSVFLNGLAVGTTDPKGYMLAVNGSTIATSVTVKTNASWPDYVFKPDYKLQPLSKVRAYIDENHHLPEMPSEADVAKDGQNLGEMNKLLVKKVEELTLYLIQQNKVIEQMKEQDLARDKQLLILKSQMAGLQLFTGLH